MKIRGQTLRERKLRRRVLGSLRAIQAEKRKGVGKRKATIAAMEKAQRQEFGIKGKPFLTEPEERAMKRLGRAVLPGLGTTIKRRVIKATRKTFDRKKYYRKYRLIGELFGGKCRLGIIMVKPELFPNRASVEKFLKKVGCKVLFTKNFVFGKDDIQRLYPHALADREIYYNFAISASHLMTSPSRVIVFEHLPVERYKKFTKKAIREKNQQNVFNRLFKDVMREAISRKNLERLGFPKELGGEIKDLAKKLDVYGYFESVVPKGFDPMIVINGVHVPDHVEVLRDARTLLTLTELQNIKKKLK